MPAAKTAPVRKTQAQATKEKAAMTTPARKTVARKAATASAPSAVPEFVMDAVPPMEQFDSYQPRMLPSNLTDVDVLLSYYETRTPLRLEGPSGCGKTHLVVAVAAKLGIPLWTVVGKGDANTRTLFGSTTEIVDPDGVSRLVFGEGVLTTAARYGGLLYLDEDNFIDPSITGALHPVLDFRGELTVDGHYVPVQDSEGVTRYVEEKVKCSSDLWVIAASNPGYAGTNQLNQAFRNRFAPLEFGYNEDVERSLLPRTLVDFAMALREMTETVWSPVGLNRMRAFDEDYRKRGWDHAVYALLSYFDPEERDAVSTMLNDSHAAQIMDQYNTGAP